MILSKPDFIKAFIVNFIVISRRISLLSSD
jgi:hypothetical protein